jgi:hypothetical protein
MLAALPAPASAAEPCEMSAADRAWLSASLDAWPQARSEVLALPPAPMPEVTVYDLRCAYVTRDGDASDLAATPHRGAAIVIGGRTLPPGPYAAAEASNRFTMSLPSVWRHAGVSSGLGLERFMTGVFLHEVMHTAQSHLLAHARDRIGPNSEGFAALSDDTIQELFAQDEAYVALYRAELELLYRAANAPTDEDARRLAGEALAAMDQRRARFFTGRRAYLARLDDTFLTMEGLGQMVMYRYLMAQPGGGAHAPLVLGEVRNNGAFWTQDAGFGLMRVVARLVPDWQARVFDPHRWQARALLAAAAAGGQG